MRIPEHAPIIDWSIAFSTLASDPAVLRVAEEHQARYRHWAKLKIIARSKGVDALAVWAATKLARRFHFRPTPFRGPRQEQVKYQITSALMQELMHLDQEAAGHLVTDTDGQIGQTTKERFVVRAVAEEAIASSLLEGAATTRHEAKEMIRTSRKPRSIGERMVLNNYQTIRYVREHRDTPLTIEFLLQLQQMLTQGTLGEADQVGRLRNEGDRIRIEDQFGNVVYEPPAASELIERLQTLCDFANQRRGEGEFIHPVIRACLLHYQLAIDHPFCDGNGRTARAVFYWYLLRNGYWLFEFMPVSTLIRKSPGRYAQSFLYSETDDYDATYFLMYMARVLSRARTEMREYIDRKMKEQRLARSIFEEDPDLNLRQRQLVLWYSRDIGREMTIDGYAREYQISYQTARTDLLALEGAKYLKSFKDGKRNIFVAGEKLSDPPIND